MAKYKPGDVVIIDPQLTSAIYNGIGAVPKMARRAGQSVTIKSVLHETSSVVVYLVEECAWHWDERMFVGLAETETTADISEKDFLEVLQYGF